MGGQLTALCYSEFIEGNLWLVVVVYLVFKHLRTHDHGPYNIYIVRQVHILYQIKRLRLKYSCSRDRELVVVEQYESRTFCRLLAKAVLNTWYLHCSSIHFQLQLQCSIDQVGPVLLRMLALPCTALLPLLPSHSFKCKGLITK